jgi:hypothetical protein
MGAAHERDAAVSEVTQTMKTKLHILALIIAGLIPAAGEEA